MRYVETGFLGSATMFYMPCLRTDTFPRNGRSFIDLN